MAYKKLHLNNVYDRKILSPQVYLMKETRQFRVYKHKFSSPLHTAQGVWAEKESILLRKQSENGQVSFGEISLTPFFYSYEINDVLPIVRSWVSGEDFFNNELVDSAMGSLECDLWKNEIGIVNRNPVLIAEISNFNSTPSVISKSFKKKIGIRRLEEEIVEVKRFLENLSPDSKLRLDANESLSMKELLTWNESFKDESQIQFIEQPFPRDKLEELFLVQEKIDIPLALDESLVWKNDLSYFEQQNWTGFFVLKPYLLSDWKETIRFLKENSNRSVVSTSFESPFGYECVCRCASYSGVDAGLDRNLFRNSSIEFPNHHQNPLRPFSVTSSMLDRLWANL